MTANAQTPSQAHASITSPWVQVCKVNDLVPGSGVAALVLGQQIALFYLPDEQGLSASKRVYALANQDPASGANVMARGILGDIRGEAVVAAPLYKHHFSLETGRCLEDDHWQVTVWPARIVDGKVEIEWV
ncbi:nitrite reductase small subunit NirD [Saccharospirillum impatiens]|uniref:nitrite reductase small subunit NirD n=1 Tax=Saccharospirillum impatiens TaxID=169438 RepID=UPI000419219F|nr:nitrite reductase small subunit NirD [Saccharospirillum impatiens]